MALTRTLHRGLALLALLAAPAAAPTARAAPSGPGAASDVHGAFGAATHAIPIAVPAFHAIAPELALRYSSSAAAAPLGGELGAGWSLGGASTLERTGARGGSPRWDRSDTFSLDGEPLVACRASAPHPPSVSTAGSPPLATPGDASPSCATGGTHATRIESYQRIAYRPADDSWEVTTKDGVRRTYGLVYWAGESRHLRYGLVRVDDPSGNSVRYEWATNLHGCCNAQLSRVTYGPVRIDLRYEARPDAEARATGAALETRRSRLRTIAVYVGGAPLRAYDLAYALGSTGRSRLVRVRPLGRDFALDAAGAVTAGSALPPIDLEYDDRAMSTYAVRSTTLPWGYAANPDSFQTGDVDGDGRADLFHIGGYHGTALTTFRGQPDGTFAAPIKWEPNAGARTGSIYPLDVDGDGLTDVVQLPGGWGGQAWRSLGDGRFAAIAAPGGVWYCDHATCTNPWSTLAALPGDVDGDGLTDFIFAEHKSPLTGPLGGPSNPNQIAAHRFRVQLARKDAAGTLSWVTTTAELSTPITLSSSAACGDTVCTTSGALLTGDVDGDGRTDVIFVEEGKVSVFRSTGLAPETTPSRVQTGPIRPSTDQSRVLTGDFNGDGRTDLLSIPLQLAPAPLTTWLGNGDGSFSIPAPVTLTSAYGTHPATQQRFLTGDVDGDGRTDVIHALPGVTYTWLARGDGTFALRTRTGLDAQQHNFDAMTTGDVNGDGRMDIVYLPLSGPLQTYVPDGSGEPLLSRAISPLGGAVRFAYVPASQWPKGSVSLPAHGSGVGSVGGGRGAAPVATARAFPTVSAVTHEDGLGAAHTTSYAYQGAAYDRIERSFLGFRRVTITSPGVAGARPVADTWYVQGRGFVAMPERIERRDDGGRLYFATVHDYTTNGDALPYRQRLQGSWTWEYGSGSAARVMHESYTYDAYGNRLDVHDEGDVAVPGDDLVHYRRYAAATSTAPFLLGLPIAEGAQTPAGKVLAHRAIEYDGGALSRGLPTKLAEWLDRDADGVVEAGDDWVVTTSRYDGTGNAIAHIDPLGAETRTEYDVSGRFVTAEQNALGHRSATQWDAVCGVSTRTTDASGAAVDRIYDAHCRLVRQLGPAAGAELRIDHAALAGPGARYQRILAPDPRGGSALIESREYLDGFGRTYRSERALGTPDAACEWTEYGPRGAASRRATPHRCGTTATAIETFEYDGFDRVTREGHADGSAVLHRYDLGRHTVEDEIGRETIEHRDARGLLLRHDEESESGAWVTARWEYDLLGRQRAAIDPAGNRIETDLDALGRLVARRDPDHGAERYVLDAAGRLVERRAGDGKLVRSRYDLLGRPVATGADRPDESELAIQVEPIGAGGTLAITVDGHLLSSAAVVAPVEVKLRARVLGGLALAAAAASQLRVTRVAVDGAVLDLAAGRASIACATALSCGGRLDLAVLGGDALFYDEPGHGGATGKLTAALGAAADELHYDAAGRLVRLSRRIGGKTYQRAQRLDPAGRVLGIDFPDGDVAGSTAAGTGEALRYDALGRLARIAGVIDAVTYDAAGRPTSIAHSNGVTDRLDYAADRGWVQRIRAIGPAGALMDLAYARSPRGLIEQVVDAADAADRWYYGYDARRQLVCAAPAAGRCGGDGGTHAAPGTGGYRYQYDATGNLTAVNSGARVYPAAGQPRPHAPLSIEGRPLAYDAAGRLISGEGRTLAWNAHGRLARVASAAGELRFEYDHAGDRVRRLSAAGATIYLGTDVQIDPDGKVRKRFAVGDRVVAERVATVTTHLHGDHLGTARVQTNAAGAQVARVRFAPYGAPTGAGPSQIGFTSEEHDPASGLLYLHERWYDPTLGRFLSPDPLVPGRSALAMNRYAYAGNDPINHDDRTGLCPRKSGQPDCTGGKIIGNLLKYMLGKVWPFAGLVVATAEGDLVGMTTPFLGPIGEVIDIVMIFAVDSECSPLPYIGPAKGNPDSPFYDPDFGPSVARKPASFSTVDEQGNRQDHTIGQMACDNTVPCYGHSVGYWYWRTTYYDESGAVAGYSEYRIYDYATLSTHQPDGRAQVLIWSKSGQLSYQAFGNIDASQRAVFSQAEYQYNLALGLESGSLDKTSPANSPLSVGGPSSWMSFAHDVVSGPISTVIDFW